MVQDPNEKVILEAQGERQGDFIFTANTVSQLPVPEDARPRSMIDLRILRDRLANTLSVLRTKHR
jgi:hypothetical protein